VGTDRCRAVERVQAMNQSTEPESLEWTPPGVRSSRPLLCYGGPQ
jgi:hypothetical protein